MGQGACAGYQKQNRKKECDETNSSSKWISSETNDSVKCNDNNNNNKYSLPFNTITLHSKIISDRCRSPGGRSYQLGVYVRPSVCLSLRTQEEKHLKKK